VRQRFVRLYACTGTFKQLELGDEQDDLLSRMLFPAGWRAGGVRMTLGGDLSHSFAWWAVGFSSRGIS
jgi:hypothetical protein